MTREELVAANLAAVEAHFHTEATGEVEKALELYTDDIVWESPARSLVFESWRVLEEAAGQLPYAADTSLVGSVHPAH